MKEKISLIIGILISIITSVIIIGELFIFNPSFLNLSYICLTSLIGYMTSTFYFAIYFEIKKNKKWKEVKNSL